MRLLITVFGSWLLAALAAWAAVNALGYAALVCKGDIGPGGGWSVAVASVAIGLALGVALTVTTIVSQSGTSEVIGGGRKWPIGIGQLYCVLAWMLLTGGFGFFSCR